MKIVKMMSAVLVATGVVLSAAGAFAAKPDKSDHPLVTPYLGSTAYSKDMKEYDEYRVFMGWNKEAKEYNTQMLEGKVTKLLYKNPPNHSLLQIFRNYEQALKQQGVEILYQCNQANMECVNGYVGAHLRQQFGLSSIGNKSGRYVYAKLSQGEQVAYIALGVGDALTDVHIVEMKAMATDMVSLNLQMLKDGLDKQGFVVVDGIYFDTDKTDVKPTSKPALDMVAALLKERPALNLYVVGHTDMQGALAHNMRLSQGRAKSVVAALTSDYGIAAGRLEGHGVGPLAPVASNGNESGMAKNRRVVLVQR